MMVQKVPQARACPAPHGIADRIVGTESKPVYQDKQRPWRAPGH